MAVKIKLSRIGAKKQPTYRVVIQEERSKRDGRLIENLGYYNPRTEPATIVVNRERLDYWLGVGALPTESVGQLLRTAGITDKYYQFKSGKRSTASQESERSSPPAPQTPGERPVPSASIGNPEAPQGEQTAGVTPEGTGRPMKVSTDDPAEG